MRKIALILAMVSLISGCGLMNSRYLYYDFASDSVKTTNVGSPMVTIKEVCKNDVYQSTVFWFGQTLSYSGKQGSIIRIHYREFYNGLARPAFSQELTYDISDDSIIVFRDTKIQVLNATNSAIEFTVLDSASYRYNPGQKIGTCSPYGP